VSDLVETFMRRAINMAAGVTLVNGEGELGQAVATLLSPEDAIYCPASTALEKGLTLPAESLTEDYSAASITVEEVFGAIAETGTIVCSSQGGKPLQAGLLPSRHCAILPESRIFATFEDFFATLGADLPTNITLISGPSRTADIELTLTVGVHGPERLDVIVVQE